MDASTLRAKLDAEHYIYDDSLITTLLVALQLGRPLLIEGAAGVGKTEIAKVMAAALDRELVRLQCYEGLDEGKALYEWNYQKQLLELSKGYAADDLPPSSATTTCWNGPCSGPSGRRSRWCCSSTRSTRPTRSSRPSCWSFSRRCR